MSVTSSPRRKPSLALGLLLVFTVTLGSMPRLAVGHEDDKKDPPPAPVVLRANPVDLEIFLGFKDDHEIIAAELIVYDALYAYCLEAGRAGKQETSGVESRTLAERRT